MKTHKFKILSTILIASALFLASILFLKNDDKEKGDSVDQQTYLGFQSKGWNLIPSDKEDRDLEIYLNLTSPEISQFRSLLKEYLSLNKSTKVSLSLITDNFDDESLPEYFESLVYNRAYCLAEQNLFWDFFDQVQPDFSIEDYYNLSRNIDGVNIPRLEDCMNQDLRSIWLSKMEEDGFPQNLTVYFDEKFTLWTDLLSVTSGEKFNSEIQTRTLGNSESKIQIVQFVDYSSPISRNFYEKIMEAYGNYPEEISLEFVQSPNSSDSPNSLLASEAALCSAYFDKFFEYQFELFKLNSNKSFNQTKLVALADKLGMDISEFEICLSSRTYQSKVLEEKERLGNYQTLDPIVLINREVVSNPDNFMNKVNEKLNL